MHYIDLRSDTVTQPTLAMRAAMAAAEVGDDVYGDDPTINELEALAAQMLGKEAAMFATSGTMGNQIGIMSQTRRGDEIIAGAESHIVMHEVGAAAVLSGVNVRQIDYPNCIPVPEMIAARIYSTMTSGQCTIGAITKCSVCLPSFNVSPSLTSNIESSSVSSSKNCGSMATVFAFATTTVSGYFTRNFRIFPAWSGSKCETTR